MWIGMDGCVSRYGVVKSEVRRRGREEWGITRHGNWQQGQLFGIFRMRENTQYSSKYFEARVAIHFILVSLVLLILHVHAAHQVYCYWRLIREKLHRTITCQMIFLSSLLLAAARLFFSLPWAVLPRQAWQASQPIYHQCTARCPQTWNESDGIDLMNEPMFVLFISYIFFR